MIWKEWREQILQGGRMAVVRPALLLGILGVVVPIQAKNSWTELGGIAVFAEVWATLFLIINVVGDAFAGERERHTLETLLATRMPDRAILFGKIAVMVAYAWTLLLVSLLLGVLAVNVTNWRGHISFYPANLFIGTLGLGLVVDVFGAAAGVVVSLLSSTVRQAQQTLAIGTTLLLFGGVAAVQSLPERFTSSLSEMQWVMLAIGVFLCLALAVLSITIARFKRARLIAN